MALVAVVLLSVPVAAVTVVTTTTYLQAMMGGTVRVTGNFQVSGGVISLDDWGVGDLVAGTSRDDPVLMSMFEPIATHGLTPGNWTLVFHVYVNSPDTPGGTVFEATLKSSGAGGYDLITLYFRTPDVPSWGDGVLLLYDLSTTFSTPFNYVLTIK